MNKAENLKPNKSQKQSRHNPRVRCWAVIWRCTLLYFCISFSRQGFAEDLLCVRVHARACLCACVRACAWRSFHTTFLSSLMDFKPFTENAAKYIFFLPRVLQYTRYWNVNIEQILTHIITFVLLKIQAEAALNLLLIFKKGKKRYKLMLINQVVFSLYPWCACLA